MTPEERFWSHVDKSGDCWLWTGALDRNGYGKVMYAGSLRKSHRLAYELLVGPIPPDRVIDHVCRVRRCVNPGHLEPVTQRDNVLRGDTGPAANLAKTHCVHGHPFTGSNLIVTRRTDGRVRRACRACGNAARPTSREYAALLGVERAAREYATHSHGNIGHADRYRAREEAREELRDALARLDALRESKAA
jgi:hypothetical protein